MRDPELASGSNSTMFTLAIWGLLFVVIAVVLAYASDHSYERKWTHDSAIDRVRELAGEAASPCGNVAVGEDARSAYACAAEHARRDESYWMTRSRRGSEGALVMIGLAARAHGKTYRVIYSDDVTGGGGRDPDRRKPYLVVEECRDIRFSATPGSYGLQHSCR